MKKLLVAGIAAVAFCGAPALAADMPVKAPSAAPLPTMSGYFDIYGGYGWTAWHDDPAVFHNNPGVLGGDARANFWLTPIWNWQFDAEGETAGKYSAPGHLQDDRFSYVLGAHTAWRDPNRGSFGLFGSIVTANNMIPPTTGPNQTYNWALYGVEAQQYSGQWTLYEQGGYLSNYNGSGGAQLGEPDHMWFGRGVVRYFSTPDDKVSFEVGYAKGPVNSGSAGETDAISNWGATWEHKLPASPLSFFLEYDGYKIEANQSPNFRTYEHLALAGIRLYFGQGTLQSNDRTGATYDQPKFTRALPWSWWVF
jgi:hypothetical protein